MSARQSGHLSPCWCTVSAHDLQKRWCPQGTRAVRGSLRLIRHTSQQSSDALVADSDVTAASWGFSFSLLFSVSSSTTRRSIAWNFFFFSLLGVEFMLSLRLFACWLGVWTSVGDTFGSRGSSGEVPLPQAISACKHSHINNALQKKIIVVNHTYTLCSDKNRTPKEFSKSARKSLEIPCHRISQQKQMSVVFAP